MLEPIPFAGYVEIDESFDRTASHMANQYVSYNEPVAWRNLCVGNIGEDSEWIYNEIGQGEPLYTHPVSKAKDRFPNYESICLQCGTTIYKPAFKTLTDEEITQVFDECYPNNADGDVVTLIDFARAILRKASEK